MTGDATWKVGTITVPAGTGPLSVTGLGGTPRALFFFGTNWLTEDAAQTGNGLGLFRGMCAPQWDSPGTLNQQAACVISTPSGNAHSIQNNAIRMLNTAGAAVPLYVANVTSLDADGFTVNFTTAAAGGYKVVYVALMGSGLNVGGRLGTYGATTLALGWKAGACLMHGAWAAPIDGTSRTQEFYGGAAYPSGNSLNWQSASATVFCFPTSNSGQYLNELNNFNPTTVVATGGHFTGPFLVTSNMKVHPSGGGLTSLTITGDSADGGMVVVWDDEDNATGLNTPATSEGGTTVRSGLSFAPGLLIGYTISDEPPGQGTGSRGAIGMSVVTPDFQWCATVDGKTAQGAFQSFQRGFADRVSGASVHAGTVELTDDGFVMTTEEDDITPVSTVWHAFGHPEEQRLWVPHIYRLVHF